MKWSLLAIVVIIAFLLVPLPVQASSAVITVTATGYIVSPPAGFTVYYISDYEVGLTWTKGADAENTLIRAAVGRLPEDREDGYLVYYGTGTDVTDTGVSLDETAATIYYRAWSQTASGTWEETGVSGFIEGVGMTLLILGLLALGLTVAMFATKNSMLGFPSGIFWAVMGGYSYQRSLATWDWQYLLFFAAMGMVIFSILAAFALRKKDLDEPAEDEGAYIDEGGPETLHRSRRTASLATAESPEGDWGDIDRLGMYETTDKTASRARARRQQKQTERRQGKKPTPWGEFG